MGGLEKTSKPFKLSCLPKPENGSKDSIPVVVVINSLSTQINVVSPIVEEPDVFPAMIWSSIETILGGNVFDENNV